MLGVVFAGLAISSWTEEQSPSRLALAGIDVFRAKGCAQCHQGPGTGPVADGFPGLDRAWEWAGSRRPGMSAEAYIRESIVSPEAFRSPAFTNAVGPTVGMPGLRLTNAEIDAIVAFLLTPTGSGTPQPTGG